MAPAATPYVLYGLLFAGLSICLVTDLRSRLIYDVVTLPTLGLSLVARLALGGWDGPFGLATGLVGAVSGFAIFFALHWIGGMGMGDVKLMGAVGAALGWPLVLAAVVFITLVGGLLGILASLWSGRLLRTLGNMGTLLLRGLRLSRREVPRTERQYVPYGVAIFAGTVWTVLWQPWIAIGVGS